LEEVAAPVQKSVNTAIGIRHADYATSLYPKKLALTSLKSGGSSVGIVRSRTQATEFDYCPKQNIASVQTVCRSTEIRRELALVTAASFYSC
jgi:hypothetical protein